ncbi:hypothetical protein BgAZ_200660 [Babesia gibsoni]|uniref:Uncharacterized protein n=1 Tax=Babesia gibsoni TaxID=33632 RepID=A0AAD8P968_BABGI|nr:hypothetical protein BgAZ_200660 [Babesia gibsoni]
MFSTQYVTALVFLVPIIAVAEVVGPLAAEKEYYHYVVNLHNTSIYQPFCEFNGAQLAINSKVVCFRAGSSLMDYFYHDMEAKCNIIFMATSDLCHTYIWSANKQRGYIPSIGDKYVFIELSLPVALSFIKARANDNDGGACQAPTVGMSTMKHLFPTFVGFDPASPTTATPTSPVSSKWEECQVIPSIICRASDGYKKYTETIFEQKHEYFLGNQHVPKGDLSRVSLKHTRNNAVKLGIPRLAYVIQVAEQFINDQMLLYHNNTLLLIERKVWQRECILYNEIKHLFRDFSCYNEGTYKGYKLSAVNNSQCSIQKLVVHIMNGFYTLAFGIRKILKSAHELIHMAPLEEKFAKMSKWADLYNKFERDISTTLNGLMSTSGMKELKRSIHAYLEAYDAMIPLPTDAAKLQRQQETFKLRRIKLEENIALETGNKQSSYGILSTNDWFYRAEASYVT